MTQIYYETVRSGLVPVEEPQLEPNHCAVATVKRDTLCYKAGEAIHGYRRHFVTKGKVYNGIQYVMPWIPQQREEP